MAKMSAQTKANIKQAMRHPIVWWRGAGLPEEKIQPWEGGIQLFAEGLKGFMSGFTKIKDRLYLGKGEGKIPPNWKSIYDVSTMTWSAVNDPIIGTFMDRKRFGEKVHRWIMRFNATVSPFLILLQCFNFGLTPMQRLVQWIVVQMVASIMSTTNAVSESKIWAGITPYTDQRAVVQLCKTIGGQMAAALGGIPEGIMGLRNVIGLSFYQIMIYGALLFTPLTIFCRWLPSFARQRVDFTVKVRGEDEAPGAQAERPPTLRECIAVVKHNRWWVMNTVVNFIKVLLPKTDGMYLYRFLLPIWYNKKGKEIGGELLWMLKNTVFGLPSVALQPFALKAVGKFSDKLNYMRTHSSIVVAVVTARYFIGYKSVPRLAAMFSLEMFKEIFDRWAPVPKGQMDYEMLDYVEWKTGLRSEGMTIAVDGMLNKLIKNNISSVLGNLVTDWTGFLGYDIPRQQQPARFINTIWPLLHIGPVVGEIIYLIALFWFKYPHNPRDVEADLIERRALAQKLKEEAQVTGLEP